jgi:hypothetical protein
LAIMIAIDKWRSYLHKNSFVIKTNHQSLCHLQDQTLSTEMQKKAMRKLEGLQFKFAYKKGSENKVVNALCRVGNHFQLNAISTIMPVWIQEILNSYQNDPAVAALLQELVVTNPSAQ